MGAYDFNGNDMFGNAHIYDEDIYKEVVYIGDDISIIAEALGYEDSILRDNLCDVVMRIDEGKEVSVIAEGYVKEDTAHNPIVVRRATDEGFDYLVTIRSDWDNNKDNYLSKDNYMYTRLWTDMEQAYKESVVLFEFEGGEYKTERFNTNERLHYVIFNNCTETDFVDSLDRVQRYLFVTDYHYASCNTSFDNSVYDDITNACDWFYEDVTHDIEENINSELHDFNIELKSGDNGGYDVVVNGDVYYGKEYKDDPEEMLNDIATYGYGAYSYDFSDFCTMSDEEIDEEYTIEDQYEMAYSQYKTAERFYNDIMFMVSDEFKNVLASWGFNMKYWWLNKEQKEYYDNFLSYFKNKMNKLHDKMNIIIHNNVNVVSA